MNTEVLQTSKSADLITFKVLIEGEELSSIYQVKSITVGNVVNKIPTARITLIDGEASSRDFKLSNEDLFIPGKEIELTAGYHSDEATIFKGIVIKHNLKIRENSSLLIVECKDKAVKMTVGRQSAIHYESKDSDVFEKLIGNYGLEAEVSETNFEHPELVQYQISDWDFIVTRAQANGLLCFVENGKLTLSKPDYEQDAVETITFGATLLDFDAEIDARQQYKSVKTESWDHANQEVLAIEGENPAISLNGNLSTGALEEVIGLTNFNLKHGGALNETQMQEWANAKWTFQQLAKIRGTVKFQGLPEVKVNTILNLQGVGDRFNGHVYISGVRHTITEGNWVTTAQFGLNPEWYTEQHNTSAPLASGLQSAIHGLQIGVVTQLESDPDKEERILVQLPVINNQEQGIWCRWASLDAGDGRGAYFLPDIRDEVIVGFINDDPNQAVILGMLYSSSKAAPIEAKDDNFERGFLTKEKLKFWFHDEEKSITLETPEGRKIVLNDSDGSIVLSDNDNNAVVLDGNGIAMESQGDIKIRTSKDIQIEGANVAIKAKNEFKAQGTAKVEVSSNGTSAFKGSLVQIN